MRRDGRSTAAVWVSERSESKRGVVRSSRWLSSRDDVHNGPSMRAAVGVVHEFAEVPSTRASVPPHDNQLREMLCCECNPIDDPIGFVR